MGRSPSEMAVDAGGEPIALLMTLTFVILRLGEESNWIFAAEPRGEAHTGFFATLRMTVF